MIDSVIALRALVLATWAGFFAWLWFSGERTRYLGPRTYWVVAFGAIALGIAALLHLGALRGRDRRPDRLQVLGAAVMVAPVLLVIIVPSPNLGALAAGRRSTGGIAAFIPAPEPNGEVGFRELDYASEAPDYAARAGISDGMEIDLTGFVTHDDGIRLTRFYVSCCAADAIPYSVRLTWKGGTTHDYGDDTWLHVKGVVVKDGDEYVVDASGGIDKVAAPKDPYLY
jgi:uncharacterized repeat protein (TIGR03943 family)